MQVLKTVVVVAGLLLLGMTLQGCCGSAKQCLEIARKECEVVVEQGTEWVTEDEGAKLAVKCTNGTISTHETCLAAGKAIMNATVEASKMAYIAECAVELYEGNETSAETFWEREAPEVDQELNATANGAAVSRLYSKSLHMRPHGAPPVTFGSLTMLGGAVASFVLLAAAVGGYTLGVRRQHPATTNYDETELLQADTENQVE